jgi:hypothetical protein
MPDKFWMNQAGIRDQDEHLAFPTGFASSFVPIPRDRPWSFLPGSDTCCSGKEPLLFARALLNNPCADRRNQQLALAAPFLSSPALAKDYFTSAFDFSRSFLFKWSVNWNFLGESIFASSGFKYGLLLCHVRDWYRGFPILPSYADSGDLYQIVVLIAFAWAKWSNHVKGGTLEVLKRGLTGSWWKPSVGPARESAYRKFGDQGESEHSQLNHF